LSWLIKDTCDQRQSKILKKADLKGTEEDIISSLGSKLDLLAKVLDLFPYNDKGHFTGKLLPVSNKNIQPIFCLCPDAYECETASCNSKSLIQTTASRDITNVTLIKGSTIYENAFVLTGKCSSCGTLYKADHERSVRNSTDKSFDMVYINTAKYLKAGRDLWVDRVFSQGVIQGMYSFHASAAAYMDYWNQSFWTSQRRKLSRRQVWNIFVQESIRLIGGDSNRTLVLPADMGLNEVTREAYTYLGDSGIVRLANEHACSECTHTYKQRADLIINLDPAAVVGRDEGRTVPQLVGDHATTSANELSQAPRNRSEAASNAPVTMVVMDGVVMGPTGYKPKILISNKNNSE
jgi:hypothetical protein